MKGHCLLNHLNSCDCLSKCVCEELKHELLKGWGGKSPPAFKCTHSSRNILSVSGSFTSLCKVEKWSPGLNMPSVVYLAPCVCAWLGVFWRRVSLISAILWLCVWHRRIGQPGVLWLLFRDCICCSSMLPCHFFVVTFPSHALVHSVLAGP